MTRETGSTHLPETACPPLEELARFDAEATSLGEHVAECLRCQARLAELRRETRLESSALELRAPKSGNPIRNGPQRVRPDARLDFGAVCSIASDARPGERLLAVVIGGQPVKDPQSDGPITVAPISREWDYAAGWDALLEESELDLDYGCMVEVWNYGRVARVQLDEAFGRVHPAARQRLLTLWQARRSGGNAPQGIQGTRVGPTILSEHDPRVSFQSDEIERTRPFYTPHVTSVRELAGSLVRLLQERAALATFAEPALATAEADVLRAVRGTGFIVPPEGHALGRVIRLLEFDVAPGTPGGSALEEEVSAWIENERRQPAQMAARGVFERARDAVGRIIPPLADRDRSQDELTAYIDVVRAAARNDAKEPADFWWTRA